MEKRVANDLYTIEGGKVANNEATLLEHPNPQFQRDSFLNLNGMWEYRISQSEDINNSKYDGLIRVPYPVEAKLSQVEKRLKENEYLIYHKTINLKGFKLSDKLLLNFLMIDQYAKVYVNGHLAYYGAKPYLPITIDIMPYIKKGFDVDLIVVVKDELDKTLPYGKQSLNPGGIFYSPCSGIMHGVYLESVSDDYIESFKINTSIDGNVRIDVNTKADYIKYEVLLDGHTVLKGKSDTNVINLKIDKPVLWNVDKPVLYDLVLKTTDTVYSYFAFRSVSIIDNKICINGKPTLLKGVLDQGYYPDGIYVVASYDCYKKDIMAMKELGFNTLRKHIKVESPYFYYLCDKLGMFVMQDCINNSDISFIRDTLLPTLRFQRRNDKKLFPEIRRNYNPNLFL